VAAEFIAKCKAWLRARGRNSALPFPEGLDDDFYALPDNGAGGSLHIVLDDGNTERSSVVFCLGYALEHGDEAGVWMATVLLALSDSELEQI
jgi:hypothetical protein